MDTSSINVLTFSSSRAGNGDYLATTLPLIKEMLGLAPLKIAFVPFAAVGNDYDDYAALVQTGLRALPYLIQTVKPINAKQIINEADVIMVGGGNTFKLLHDIYELDLLDLLCNKVVNGTPYIGWSAGANIAGATIGTTNDMPIIAPRSFQALGFLPFQINPHYINANPDNHYGETRDQRLEEFIMLNPALPVVALPEGTALQLQNGRLLFLGTSSGALFTNADGDRPSNRQQVEPGTDLSFLL